MKLSIEDTMLGLMLGTATAVQWYFLLHLLILINGDATVRDWRFLQSSQGYQAFIMVIALGIARLIIIKGLVDRYYKPIASSKYLIFKWELLKVLWYGLYIIGLILFSFVSSTQAAVIVYFLILPVLHYHLGTLTYYAYDYYRQNLDATTVMKRLRFGIVTLSLLPKYEQMAAVYRKQWYFTLINIFTFGLGYAYTTPHRLLEYAQIKTNTGVV